MNVSRAIVLAPLVIIPCWAQPRLQLEAGASHFALSSPKLPDSPPAGVTITRDDDSVWAPFVAIDYSFTERIGLRLSYHHLDKIKHSFDRPVEPQPSPWVLSTRYTDDLHLLSLAPELRWTTGRTTVSLSPQLNWVHVRQEFGTFTDAPHVQTVPPVKRTDQEFTLGVSAGVAWALGGRWSLGLRYSYIDLDPSWSRRGHVISGGLRLAF